MQTPPQGATTLSISNLSTYFQYAVPLLKSLVLAIFTLWIGWKVSRWIQELLLSGMRKAKLDEPLAQFLASIVRYTILAMTIIATLGQIGVETTSIVAIFASAGIAIGLALQGNLSNFASGILLLFYRPFHLKDKVDLSGHIGLIEEIGLFSVTLRTPEDSIVIIPNSVITSGTITNITRVGKLRIAVDAGVAYGSSVDDVGAALLAAAASVPDLHTEPIPFFAFTEMADSSLNFKIYAWCDPWQQPLMEHKLRCAVYKALNEAKLEIPFPQLVLHKAK